MDSRYKIPALWIYLKSIYDTGVEEMRGRGKTRTARYSEIISNEFSRSTLARKVYESYIYIPVPQTDTGR